MPKPIVYHIPVCPFSQRLEILLALKGMPDAVEFRVVDITIPRDPALLAKTPGSTALPVMEMEDGRILKESMVLLRYLDERFSTPMIARSDVYERAVERLFISREGAFGNHGYSFVMNRDRARTEGLRQKLLADYRWLNEMLMEHNPEGTYLFDRFGLGECVYTSLMMRYWFLEYYEGFALPETEDYARVVRWRAACLAHPAAQQVCYDEVVKLYYDYAVGAGNGALPAGRSRSSFVLTPDWPGRPMPPKDKYDRIAPDAELGLI